MARKAPHSLKTNGRTAVKKARGAWHDVESTLADALDRGHDAAEGAARTINGTRRETAKRASAARDALTGRSQRRRRWGILAAVASAGVGAVAGAAGARLIHRTQQAAVRPTDPIQPVPATPAGTMSPGTVTPALVPIAKQATPEPVETATPRPRPSGRPVARPNAGGMPTTTQVPATATPAHAGSPINGTDPRKPTK